MPGKRQDSKLVNNLSDRYGRSIRSMFFAKFRLINIENVVFR